MSYFIGQTPLKFLLQPKIDVAKDSKVTDLKRERRRRSSLDHQGQEHDRRDITDQGRFDGQNHALKEWTVTDPQGYDTRVMLSNLNPNAHRRTKDLFVIDEQKLVSAELIHSSAGPALVALIQGRFDMCTAALDGKSAASASQCGAPVSETPVHRHLEHQFGSPAA